MADTRKQPATLRHAAAVRASQRTRIVLAAADCARTLGVSELSVAAISARSGVSRRTFYEVFENREACLLATFEEGVHRGATVAVPAFAAQETWGAAVRAGLAALLAFLDEESTLGAFCVVDALGAGEAVLERRAATLRQLAAAVDAGREHARSQAGLTELTAEAVVGALLSILHTRLRQPNRQPTIGLLGPLMSILVRPYLGAAAAEAELRRLPREPRATHLDAAAMLGVRIRWTYRTIAAIRAVAELSGRGVSPSNREVAEAAGISDAGQISKLLHRLESHGLIENRRPPGTDGQPNAWRPTAGGRQIAASFRPGDA